jgi:hypothetical protein
MQNDPFQLGHSIVPAQDSQLMGLGYQVDQLGLRAIGVVIDTAKKKSLIQFPELNLQIWMSHHEIKDIKHEAQHDNAFKAIVPKSLEEQKENLGFLLSFLSIESKATFVLDVNKGDIVEVWDSDEADLKKFFSGPLDTSAIKISLGLEEMDEEIRSRLKEFLGERLIFDRLLPSGMHKLEWALYIHC